MRSDFILNNRCRVLHQISVLVDNLEKLLEKLANPARGLLKNRENMTKIEYLAVQPTSAHAARTDEIKIQRGKKNTQLPRLLLLLLYSLH